MFVIAGLSVGEVLLEVLGISRHGRQAEREHFAALTAVHQIHLSGRRNRLLLDNDVGDRLAYDAHGSRSLFDGF